jgi:hypothetical protein
MSQKKFHLFATAYRFAEIAVTDGKMYPAGQYRFSTNDPGTVLKPDGLKPANTDIRSASVHIFFLIFEKESICVRSKNCYWAVEP